MSGVDMGVSDDEIDIGRVSQMWSVFRRMLMLSCHLLTHVMLWFSCHATSCQV